MSETLAPRAPVTERGRRTRARLLDAARTVFERRGFGATRMGDIAEEAGFSHGTVYTYFETKEDVLAATLDEIVTEIRESSRHVDSADPVERIAVANRRYLSVYLTHARVLRAVEEVSNVDARFMEILDDLRRTHAARVAHQISRFQRAGLAREDIDPTDAAAALTAMVEGYARAWPDRLEADINRACDTINSLWVHGVGLTTDAAGEP